MTSIQRGTSMTEVVGDMSQADFDKRMREAAKAVDAPNPSAAEMVRFLDLLKWGRENGMFIGGEAE
jgi:hypothetical protein